MLSAGLLAPATKTPVGAVDDVTITSVRWLAPTLLKARHESEAVRVEALIDLSRDGTAVEVVARKAITLSGTGAWTFVLKEGAHVPLLGKVADGLRVGFLEDQRAPLVAGTVPDVERPLPPTTGPVEPCFVRALYAKAEPGAPRWEAPSSAAAVHRGASTGGWASAWADGFGVVIHGFVRDEDVQCDADWDGALALTGVGAGAADGVVTARAARLPAGTRLFASPKDLEPIATLKAPTRGLLLEDGSWRIDHVQSGSGEVRFRNVFVGRDTPLALEPRRAHGVGSVVQRPHDWPRLRR